MIRRLGRGALAVAMATGIAGTAAAQDSVVDFYDGKTITIYVGFGPGGGYDLYARLAAEHLGEHIPGNPEVIVENMPGAGGRRAAQYLYQVAPQDGTALGVIVQSVALDSATGAIPGDIDASQFNAIGRLVANYELGILWHTSPTKTFEQAKENEVNVASTGAGSASSFVPRMLNDIEGTQFKVIQGYEGSTAALLAMEQGEVEGAMSGLAGLRASYQNWFDDEMINVIWQLSNEPHPDFPDVPAVGQMGETEDEKAMLRLVAGAAEVGRSLVAPPNVPEERVEALRDAFMEMVQSEEFKQAAAERNLELDPITGAELQEVIASQMNVSDAAIEMARSYIVTQ